MNCHYSSTLSIFLTIFSYRLLHHHPLVLLPHRWSLACSHIQRMIAQDASSRLKQGLGVRVLAGCQARLFIQALSRILHLSKEEAAAHWCDLTQATRPFPVVDICFHFAARMPAQQHRKR